MTADPFLRIDPEGPLPDGAPVLYRAVLRKTTEPYLFPDAALRAYPTLVLYGGPSRAQYLRGPVFENWDRGMQFWAFNLDPSRNLASEVVPIAPDRWPLNSRAPAWPHTGWRWWYVRETGPVQRYALRAVRPDFFDWVAV